MVAIDNERTIVGIFWDTIGYTTVAVACCLAGYVVRTGVLPDSPAAKIGALVCLAMGCYFFSREVLLEQATPSLNSSVKSMGIQLPCVLLGLTFLLVFGFGDLKLQVFLLLVLLLTPFAFLSIRSVSLLQMGNIDEAYGFANRIFFPALAACLLSFSAGWSIAAAEIDLVVMVWAAIIIIALKVYSILLAKAWLNTVAIGLPLLTLVGTFFVLPELFSVLTYGAAFALAMGLAETSKRLHTFGRGNTYYPPTQGHEFYRAGATWGSALFPLALCLSTVALRGAPTWPVYIYAIVQTIIGLFFNSRIIRQMSSVHLVLGYALPMLLVGATLLNLPQILLPQTQLGTVSGILLTLGFAGILGAIAVPRRVLRFQGFFKNLSYSNPESVFTLLTVALALSSLLIGLVAFVASGRSSSPEGALLKLQDLTGSLICFYVVWLVYLLTNLWSDGRDSGSPYTMPIHQLNTSNPADAESKHQDAPARRLLLLATTARPLTSLIPGLLVFVALVRQPHAPIAIVFLHSAVIVLITMAGFVLNDICDYRKDQRAGRNDKPIALGLVRRSAALIFSACLASAALGTEFIFESVPGLAVVLGTLFLLILYSPIAQKLPIAKGAVTATLSLSPIAYAATYSDADLPLIIIGALFLFIFSRELVLDALDVAGDRQSHIRTIAFYFGKPLSSGLGWSGMGLAALLFLVGGSGTIQYQVIIWFSALTLAWSWWWRGSDERSAIRATRVSMALGAFAVATLF